MTKEETLAYIKAYLDGDTAVGNIIPLRSVLESAIKYLSEPSLPSDLDEAAEKYSNIPYNFGEFVEIEYEFGDPVETVVDDKVFVKDAFKAGAKWMAGQGVSFDTEMSWLDSFGFQIGWPEDTSIFDYFNEGDKVVVQIRKK